MLDRTMAAITLVCALALLAACGTPVPQVTPLAKEIVFYDWAEDLPQEVLDAFTAEYGVKVTYLTYETQQEAVESMRGGAVYDVVVLDNDHIPQLVREGLLAEIDYYHVPNFKNVSAGFRDLVYDPDNRHAVPFNWGTTGLLIRTDLIDRPVTRWADLWELNGKIAVRDEARDQLGVALKALGYSINTEDPRELEAALEHLLAIRQQVTLVDPNAEAAIPLLASGEVVALVGWAEDALEGRRQHDAIAYVLPDEGTMLWGDNFTIPANSPHKYTAEVLINFLLRPEVAAQIVNANHYAIANEAAYPYIDPEIRDNPVIFPSSEDLENAEVYSSLSPEGLKLYEETWARFKAAGQ